MFLRSQTNTRLLEVPTTSLSPDSDIEYTNSPGVLEQNLTHVQYVIIKTFHAANINCATAECNNVQKVLS